MEPSLKPQDKKWESLRPSLWLLQQGVESQQDKSLTVSRNQNYHKQHPQPKREKQERQS